jgi:hypothetical protein
MRNGGAGQGGRGIAVFAAAALLRPGASLISAAVWSRPKCARPTSAALNKLPCEIKKIHIEAGGSLTHLMKFAGSAAASWVVWRTPISPA